MRIKNIGLDIAIGVAGGIIATRATDHVQKMLWRATPPGERAREPETEDGSSAESAARKLLEGLGQPPSEKQLKLGTRGIHYALGLTWGPLYCLLRRGSGMTPVGAGFASGAMLSLIVDETLNPLIGITPPSREFPTSSHVRGFLTHIFWGLSAAAAAEALHRTLRHPLPR